MNILESLTFVRGAVSKKDFVPVLKHFSITNGRIQAHNGVLSLSSPIECDLAAQPLAEQFFKAIQLCDETVSLHMTQGGKLAIKSGNFKAFIECSSTTFPDIQPEGEHVAVKSGILKALRALAPMMGTDASRLWSHGILLSGCSAYVTNNIVLVEKWLGEPFPVVMGIPSLCVNELLRIGEEPSTVQSNGRTVTFHFTGGRWLTSALLTVSEWPNPEGLFNATNEPIVVLDDFFNALENLKPFTDILNSVWIMPDGTISTANTEETGVHLKLTNSTGFTGRYSVDQLLLLRGIATSVAWGNYPKPCLFYGEGLRGVIIGIRE